MRLRLSFAVLLGGACLVTAAFAGPEDSQLELDIFAALKSEPARAIAYLQATYPGNAKAESCVHLIRSIGQTCEFQFVALDGRKVGVSVTRLVTFPFGQPYTMAAATTLLQRKLDDIELARTQASAADRWTKSMLVAEAFDAQHAQVGMQAWAALPAATRADIILVIAVTDGDDRFIYTDQ